MKIAIATIVLSGIAGLASGKCCFSQNITFDAYKPQTPAQALLGQTLEFGGIQFISVGVASQVPGVNIGPSPRSAPNFMYYGPTTGVGANGFSGLTVTQERAPYDDFYVDRFAGSCGIVLPLGLIPGAGVVTVRCTVNIEAYAGADSKGSQDFVFNTGEGTEQALKSSFVNLNNFSTRKWTTLILKTKKFEVKLGPAAQFVDVSSLNGVRPYVFFDDIGTVVSPKNCVGCAST